MSEKKLSILVAIENITDAQKTALIDLFATWQEAGNLGCSRWTGFFADGDGNFRPRITVNGNQVLHQDILPQGQFWTGGKPWHGEYKIDFDAIATAKAQQ